MSATDELRRLLDARGVEWWETNSDIGCVFTWWHSSTFGKVHAMDNDDGTFFMACLNNCNFTPEQAVEATLGRDDVFTREDVEGAFVSGYSLGTLPAGSDPAWDQNRQTVDEHMEELGWVRKEAATLGRGTCEMEYVSDFMSWHCKACDMMDMAPRNPKPRYCKWCGRKVVDE